MKWLSFETGHPRYKQFYSWGVWCLGLGIAFYSSLDALAGSVTLKLNILLGGMGAAVLIVSGLQRCFAVIREFDESVLQQGEEKSSDHLYWLRGYLWKQSLLSFGQVILAVAAREAIVSSAPMFGYMVTPLIFLLVALFLWGTRGGFPVDANPGSDAVQFGVSKAMTDYMKVQRRKEVNVELRKVNDSVVDPPKEGPARTPSASAESATLKVVPRDPRDEL